MKKPVRKRRGYASGGAVKPLVEPHDYVGRLQQQRPGNLTTDRKMEVRPPSGSDYDDNTTMPGPDPNYLTVGKARGGKVRKVVRKRR